MSAFTGWSLFGVAHPFASAVRSLPLCGLLVIACATHEAPTTARIWLTTADQSHLLEDQGELASSDGDSAAVEIAIDTTRRFQTMAGFGAALTDASAHVIQRMSAESRQQLLEELFGDGEGRVGLDLVRLTIGASDFSPSHYTLDDSPPGVADTGLTQFSIDRNREDVLPMLKQAMNINPRLQVVATPWSAPAWMKTSGSLFKGTLRPESYDDFARYLVKYVEAYRHEGVPIAALTVQNEPHHEPADYPGMRLEAPARAALVGRHLGPLLEQRGLRTQILDWDHNWDAPESPLGVLSDSAARRYVSGVAWHCYASTDLLPNQSTVHDAWPDKDTWFTECSGGEWDPTWESSLLWQVRHLIIGTTRHWARGVLFWNLALDENHGPHLGGCKDCRGVVTIDSRTGVVTRNPEYYALAHASAFVRPGATRVASEGSMPGIDHVAFLNADDRSVVLVLANSGTAQQTVGVATGGRRVAWRFPALSVATLVMRPREPR